MGQKSAMINAIIHEIDLTELTDKEDITTIYIGGGTPSILNAEELQSIRNAIYKKFNIHKDAEVTFEANPDNISPAALKQWKELGINRLSVGIQSFQDEELKWMNRAHTAAESIQCIDNILEAGYSNFSVDLIYGSPLLSNKSLKKNIDIITGKNVPHISCYALTVEPKTPLDKMISQKTSLPVSNDKQSDQYLLLMQWMRAAGYEHYEISNFATPGMRSKHNSSYWQGKAYYGFGPSAHSFNGSDTRKWNIANNSLYIQSLQKDTIPHTEEKLTKVQQLNEYIMISLRTIEGLNLTKLGHLFGENSKQKLLIQSKKYGEQNIQLINENLRLTDHGKLLADGIAGDLFFTGSSL